ncbi:MAG TPA: hypothetical protein VNO70_20460 [Blastocatellia bacterium]|nr:hypothetical protein [Blastocatellia bacterium]
MVSRSISHYRILKKLGAGGLGEIYLAEDIRPDRRVALKTNAIGPSRLPGHVFYLPDLGTPELFSRREHSGAPIPPYLIRAITQ